MIVQKRITKSNEYGGGSFRVCNKKILKYFRKSKSKLSMTIRRYAVLQRRNVSMHILKVEG